MNDEQREPYDAAIEWGLAEHLASLVPPDLRARVADRLACGARGHLRPHPRSTWKRLLLAAAVLFGVVVVAGIAIHSARSEPHRAVAEPQDPQPSEPRAPDASEPVTVATRAEIEALPEATRSVVAIGVCGDDLLSLLRLRELRELELRAKHGTSPTAQPTHVVSDDDLQLLAAQRSLRAITLVHARGLSARGLRAIAGLPELVSFAIEHADVDDEALAALEQMRTLRTLSLHGCYRVGIGTMRRVVRMTTLRELDLSRCNGLDAESLRLLAAMTGLVELRLDAVGVHDLGVRTDGSVEFDSVVTDDVIESFRTMHSLRRLSVDFTHVSAVAADALEQRVPGLQVVGAVRTAPRDPQPQAGGDAAETGGDNRGR